MGAPIAAPRGDILSAALQPTQRPPSETPGAESTGAVLGLDNIRLELPVAGVGSRILAAGVDSLVVALAMAAWAAIAFLVLPSALGDWRWAILVLGFFALDQGYFVVSEIATRGRTLGKTAVGLAGGGARRRQRRRPFVPVAQPAARDRRPGGGLLHGPGPAGPAPGRPARRHPGDPRGDRQGGGVARPHPARMGSAGGVARRGLLRPHERARARPVPLPRPPPRRLGGARRAGPARRRPTGRGPAGGPGGGALAPERNHDRGGGPTPAEGPS